MRRISNYRILLETLAAQPGGLAGRRVVDVGCGDGRLARSLVEQGAASAIGIECSPRQLAKARALPPAAAVTVIEGVAEAMPLPDGAADVMVFFNSLHHVPPAAMATALREAARVLVPGGLLCVCEPLAAGPFFELCRSVDDEGEVRRLAQEALRDVIGHGFALEHDETYCRPIVMADFETFRERLVSANAERDAAFARQDADLRAAFARLAGRDADGAYTFDQPARIMVVRRA